MDWDATEGEVARDLEGEEDDVDLDTRSQWDGEGYDRLRTVKKRSI